MVITRTDPAGNNLISWYFRTVWEILSSPSAFFRKMPSHEARGYGGPLAFALVTHWIGSAISYLWRLSLGSQLDKFFSSLTPIIDDVTEMNSSDQGAQFATIMMAREKFMHWVWGAGSVIVDPFLTLFGILFTSFFVFIGARLLVPEPRPAGGAPVTYESAVRIVCFGMTPAILAALPLFGTPLSALLTAIVTIIGAREVYRISNIRAIFVGLFPKVLFLGILLMGLALLFAVVLKAITSFF